MSISLTPAFAAPAEARYETLRTLGQGSTGAVYLAHDRATGEHVALKKLLRMDAKNVLRLKHEFRSLADIHHPNLVKLYDLGVGDDGWFLTMEYIGGPDLMRYVGFTPGEASLRPAIDAFHQLACGIRALHEVGMLHRDLKPSNVLVAGSRVVVLDFGLARELDRDVEADEAFIAGTPAYMAPEQARGQQLTEAADWYAFGVMLYQVLAGELPIEGRTAIELLSRKGSVDPLPLERVAPYVSPDLGRLCDRLLLREPASRPSGEEILQILENEGAAAARADGLRPSLEPLLVTETRSRTIATPLVGREPELLQLEAALEQARDGGAVTVHVRGASGAGKTALVEQFLAELDRIPGHAELLTLRGRCCEREAMPFKALDGVMDTLVRHLAELADADARQLLPIDVVELAQLFPALQRLPGVERMVEQSAPRGEAIQIRSRAELALRDLILRVAARRRLVLWIDDLQWGDLDSANILRSWALQLSAAPILLVFSYRSDEIATSPCLGVLLDREADSAPAARERVIDIGTLHEVELRLLCEQRLGSLATQRPDLIDAVVRESQGNPFYALQLAALARARHARGERGVDALSIGAFVTQTSELLAPDARRLLRVLAIAGRPLPPRFALRAAGVSEGRVHLHALRGLRLIRTRDVSTSSEEQQIEVYHDRVREGVHASLSERELEHVHDSLLRVLEREREHDADWLHTLALGAGRRDVALRHGLIAAERASNALAFERAAELYRACLQLRDPAAADGGELWRRLAQTLARCRRGVEAAEAYLQAAKQVAPDAAVPLLRLAASHFLRSGEFARGEAIGRQVLSALDLDLPESDSGVIAAIAWERTILAVRGIGSRLRPENEVAPELLQKIDLYTPWSTENQAHDPLRAALVQARCLRWALAAGERIRLSRALCLSATMSCVSGSPRAERKSAELLARARELAADGGDDALRADVLAAEGVCAFLLGRPADVLAPSYEAERMYRADTRGDAEGEYYHRLTVVAMRIGALNLLGECRRALSELQAVLQEARATNNRSVVLHLTLNQSLADEIQHQPANSKARLEEERKLLPAGRFGSLHLLHMQAVMRTACSAHDYAWAEPLIREDWQRWKRSPVRQSAFLSVLARGSHARYVLNRHVVERRTGDPAALVRDDLRALERSRMGHWGDAAHSRVLARLAVLSGNRPLAAEHLRQAIEFTDRFGAANEAARDRYALGYLIGGSEGAAMRAEAERVIREKSLIDPEVDLHGFYPEILFCTR